MKIRRHLIGPTAKTYLSLILLSTRGFSFRNSPNELNLTFIASSCQGWQSFSSSTLCVPKFIDKLLWLSTIGQAYFRLCPGVLALIMRHYQL